MATQTPLPKPGQKAYTADLVICIDGTGSMADCIEKVKDRVRGVVQDSLVEFAKEYNASKMSLRYRLIVFRDLRHDGDLALETFDFTENPEEFVKQLDGIEAKGGGDEEESAIDALIEAFHSSWRENTHRGVALLTDAPCRSNTESATLEKFGIQGLEGDKHDLVTLQAQKHIKLFVAGPECEVFFHLSTEGLEQVIWEKADEASLADVDMDDFFKMIAKTLTHATVTQPIVT